MTQSISLGRAVKGCQGNHRALGRVLPLRKSQSSMQFGRNQFTLSSVPGGPEETKSCGTAVVLVSVEWPMVHETIK